MSDSPSTSETFVRQFYPDDESLEAHHKAIVAQARQHERSLILARQTHKRINELAGEQAEAFTRIEAGQRALGAEQAEFKRLLADRSHATALRQSLVGAAQAVLVALITLAGAYLMQSRPAPTPTPLSAETLEKIRLWEQRTGYTLGKKPPGEAAPPDPPEFKDKPP